MSKSTETTLHYRFLDGTPVGRLLLAADCHGLRYLLFADSPQPGRHPWPSDTEPVEGGDVWKEDTGQLDEAAQQLTAWFAGDRHDFDLPLAPQGTLFQQKVWSVLQEIPWGETWTYGGIAERIGQPAASRAVGLANGRNPISIIIPCHRVIGRNGQLTGYGGGLSNKRTLLELEGSWPVHHHRQQMLFAASDDNEVSGSDFGISLAGKPT